MPHILIIDGSTICRELLGKALEAKGLAVSYAESCAAADRHLSKGGVDVAVIDPTVDGGAGMDWLQRLQRSANPKKVGVVVLTDVSAKETVLCAGRLGIRDYMLKQRFSLPELLQRIGRLMSAETRREPAQRPTPAPQSSPSGAARPAPTPRMRLAREQTLARMEECGQAKTLPGVVTEIMGLVNSPRGAISDVAQTLKRDPVLAARVLQLANSAAFVSQKPRVTSLEEATRNIGISGVRTMVLSAGIFELFSADKAEAVELLRFWQHSFAVAAVMERLVPTSETVCEGTPHLVGLCHDLADLALAQQFPDEFAAAAELSRESAESIFQARTRVLGLPYYELASVMLMKLGLPAGIISPITEVIAGSMKKGAVELRSELSRGLRLANVYANGLMLPGEADAPITPITRAEFRNLRNEDAPLALDDSLLRSEVLTMVNVLSGAPPRVISQLCRQPIEKTGRRIWYARHAMFCGFDPLAAFLGLVGEIAVHDGPPQTAADLQSCDMICIADGRQEHPVAAQQRINDLLRMIGQSPIPILFFSGVDPELLPQLPNGKCEKLPVQLPRLIELFNQCAAETPAVMAA